MQLLYTILTQVENEKEFQKLLDTTFTEKEQKMIVERWQILSALDEGLSQREVARKVNCSVVTVTRGAKVYRQNKAQVQKWLKLLKEEP